MRVAVSICARGCIFCDGTVYCCELSCCFEAHALLGPGGLLSGGAMASCPGLDGRSQSVLAELVDGMSTEEGRPKRKAKLTATQLKLVRLC